MSKRELVSVITPMYNAEKYISETVKSVINQTYDNWEMIIVDNCSTDKSREIVESIDDSRIRLIRLEYNSGGPARPRNIGLESAKGEYIAFLDADDVWLSEKIEKQVELIETDHCGLVHTFANIIDQDSKKIGVRGYSKMYSVLKYLLNNKNILFYINYININSVLMKKIEGIRFTEDKNLVALEDWRLWIELQNNIKIEPLNETLINYRIHNNSISNRDSDIGYRKTLYLLSYLFLKNEITLKHYSFSTLLHIFKIITKNLF